MLSKTWHSAALFRHVSTRPQALDPDAPLCLGSARLTYPVPHCSTFVMLSWRRLFNQATSSCLCTSCQPMLCTCLSVAA